MKLHPDTQAGVLDAPNLYRHTAAIQPKTSCRDAINRVLIHRVLKYQLSKPYLAITMKSVVIAIALTIPA
ncbi:hypothetical protein [Nostoc sp. UHCC 0252]|uniref:hypothetical protein n=1 Tax=Nostoc sp. UHCC 0252 TaxID=3110241 RepID=UPI002B20BB2F|nr:hypothetical protein [Nostoc sp. UHCC 0252]MEA5601279.1 hypothetical protein [Nostoc sp. UHCC 0252]